eukprot:2278069-Pyramimonas_sp.AAC.1
MDWQDRDGRWGKQGEEDRRTQRGPRREEREKMDKTRHARENLRGHGNTCVALSAEIYVLSSRRHLEP